MHAEYTSFEHYDFTEKNNNNVEKLIIEKKKHVKAGKQAGYNKQEEKTGLDRERKIT